MADLYTKLVLTVIAIATVVLVVQNAVRLNTYQGQCGRPEVPCFINTATKDWLAVRVLP